MITTSKRLRDVEQYPSPEDFIILLEEGVPPYTREDLPAEGRVWETARRVCSEREIEVLELRLIHDLTFLEIGVLLDITKQAAAGAYYRALKHTKEALLHGR